MSDNQIIAHLFDALPSVLKTDVSFSEDLQRACDLAAYAHQGQTRKYSGLPFLTHPVAVTLLLAQHYTDHNLLIAAMLHDVVEDCEEISMQSIYEQFGSNVGYIVDAVTKTTNFFYGKEEVVYNDKIEKLLAGGMKDIRCLLLKLADREHNIATLAWLHASKQIKMTFETQAIYVPLKEMLAYNSWWCCEDHQTCCIDSQSEKFIRFMEKYTITDPKKCKSILYSQVFHGFDEEIYNNVYEHTNSIVWKIKDKDMFISLAETNQFDDIIDVIDMTHTWLDGFCAKFVYKKWQVFTKLSSKFSLWSFNT